jgi:hypothetical protein
MFSNCYCEGGGMSGAFAENQASLKKVPRSCGYITSYNPQAKTRALLDQIETVQEEYRNHWPLTCRQTFYRLVGAHGYDNSEAAYNRLINHLANARRARVIPFEAIRDDGVTTYHRDHFDSRNAFLRRVRLMGNGSNPTNWPSRICIRKFGAERQACCRRSTEWPSPIL